MSSVFFSQKPEKKNWYMLEIFGGTKLIRRRCLETSWHVESKVDGMSSQYRISIPIITCTCVFGAYKQRYAAITYSPWYMSEPDCSFTTLAGCKGKYLKSTRYLSLLTKVVANLKQKECVNINQHCAPPFVSLSSTHLLGPNIQNLPVFYSPKKSNLVFFLGVVLLSLFFLCGGIICRLLREVCSCLRLLLHFKNREESKISPSS